MNRMQNQNEKRLDMLKKRVNRCVCKSCGNTLSLRQLDYNEFEENLVITGKQVTVGTFNPKKAPQVTIKMKGMKGPRRTYIVEE